MYIVLRVRVSAVLNQYLDNLNVSRTSRVMQCCISVLNISGSISSHIVREDSIGKYT